jgi:hypothetical protein
MTKILIFIITLIILSSCTNHKSKIDSYDISVYESYNIADIQDKIIEANKLIREKQLDTILERPSGVELLDKIEADNMTGSLMDDYPLMQVLLQNARVDSLGNADYGSTSIIGLTKDSSLLRKYIIDIKHLFPEDMQWVITGHPGADYSFVHAFKKAEIIKLNTSDIDSIFLPKPFSGILGTFDKVTSSSEKRVRVFLTLKEELRSSLSNKTYSIVINTQKDKYSGSIVDFSDNPKQYINMGEFSSNDLEGLTEILNDRISYY